MQVLSLSPRTALYATVGHIANDGNLALPVSSGAVGINPIAGEVPDGGHFRESPKMNLRKQSSCLEHARGL